MPVLRLPGAHGMREPMKPQGSNGIHVVAENRRARHDYEILERIEAGLELRGTEVKSLRQGQVSLAGSYATVENGEAWLLDCHIAPYSCGNIHNHEPKRPRRLLLHRREILRLETRIRQRGFTAIPLRVYFRRGRAKVELGIARGRERTDRREMLKRREADREASRALAAARRR